MKQIIIGFLFCLLIGKLHAVPSWNKSFVGVWRGRIDTSGLCKNKTQDKGGYQEVIIKIIDTSRKKTPHFPQLSVVSGWGCFGEMTLNGLSFADELWSSTGDHLCFSKLVLEKHGTLSGEFRFDLNGHALKANFMGLKKFKEY